MPSSIRPGDVLAERYRLVDLLAESRGGRFWRAHDRVLERHVALHVIAADDPRADVLLDAARRSAAVHDRRLLRVLDADKADGLCYVVNEWGTGDSLDIMLANEGPISPRRAAWLVSEVAASIAVGHAAGVPHGRLVPENVLVDHAGAVRLIGFAVDAAMFGLAPGRTSTDVSDLGGLLYCALTGKWPGTTPSGVPAAPVEGGRVLRPRQVRAGIPRPLDALCDEVLNAYGAGWSNGRPRGPHDLATAQGIADHLADFVGDPTGLAEAEAAAGHRDTGTIVLPPLADPPVRDPREQPAPQTDPQTDSQTDPPPTVAAPLPEIAGPTEPERAEPTELVVPPGPPAEPVAEPPSASTPPRPTPPTANSHAELPTEAGLPIFDDDNDDVSWLSARTTPPPPPPPFEEPPERPLFAPEPAEGPARRPRPGSTAATAGQPPGYWPWDTGTGTGGGFASVTSTGTTEPVEAVPGRTWLRLAAILGGCLLLLLAVVVAYNLGRGRTPLGAVPDDKPTTATSPRGSATPPARITGITATDLDPQGDPPEENPDLTGLAVDGNPTTAWRTMTYQQDFGPGGLKSGVGLVLDLGKTHDVSSVDLTFVGAPTSYSVYVTDRAPTDVQGLRPVASQRADTTRSKVSLRTPVSGRYVTVWLTSIPPVAGGFRGEVAEVTVRG